MEASRSTSSAFPLAQDGSTLTYQLRTLIDDIPLSADEDGKPSHITCVDTWNGNLYIGTSVGEVLHYVSIPPDPSEESGQPSYIFATKLKPPYKPKQEGAGAGVKQILLLPDPSKACILCHGTLTFYTLPELSPAFGGQIQQSSCSWVGGLDHGRARGENTNGDTVIVICLRQRLRLVRISRDGRNPQKIRDIELGGVATIQRQADLACVADGTTYALLDVVNQRKNDLFPISSLTPIAPPPPLPPAPPDEPSQRSTNRPSSRSLSFQNPTGRAQSHQRNSSMSGQANDSSRLQAETASSFPPRSSSRQLSSPAQPSSREPSPSIGDDGSPRPSTDLGDKPLPPAPAQAAVELLPPNIVLPTPNEFLLTTGTRMADPGVGMFVNMDGDPTRGTLEFSSYPESLVLDDAGRDETPGTPGGPGGAEDGYAIAIVRRQTGEGVQKAIEIQRWNGESGHSNPGKEWIMVGMPDADVDEQRVGLRLASDPVELSVPEISKSLRLRRLPIQGSELEITADDTKRSAEEDRFASRFARLTATVLFYSNSRVSWVMRNPLVSQLEQQLNLTVQRNENEKLRIDVQGVQRVINSIRGQEPRDELEFVTLTYIRQKVSLLLFGNLILQTASGFISYEQDKRYAEEALVAGDIDPRVILSLVPALIDEIVEGERGVWIAQGHCETIKELKESFEPEQIVQDPKGPYGDNLLSILKRFLLLWRRKKGFGSVADERHLFQTLDAALLRVLLLLDQSSPRGPATPGSVRAELNQVVDKGVDCFDRAVELFETHQRLFVLSRLYQSRHMSAQVLSTWKRILEGEADTGGEFVEGESNLRRYLTNIRDQGLVSEYGSWLANRNPKLGVQVFADDNSKVKFEPKDAVEILKNKAPGAVKDYLEHLVFGKTHTHYVNELIAFYLDTVLNELETSSEAKNTLISSYETYRALRPPKPTYRQFIEDNASDVEWQQNRLRLLQLIGGSHGAASRYDVGALRQRLAPYSNELVPEMIILNGREGKHDDALRLLTHGLGDYDTAIRYCLLGGSSIFHSASGLAAEQSLPSKDEQAKLFERLLHEFFAIEDPSERLERTAELLVRFGGWFDVADVLALIPDSWSVELVSGFLVHALRALMRERNEASVVKALASAQNLRRSVEVVDKIEEWGATIVRDSEAGDGDVEAG